MFLYVLFGDVSISKLINSNFALSFAESTRKCLYGCNSS